MLPDADAIGTAVDSSPDSTSRVKFVDAKVLDELTHMISESVSPYEYLI